MKTQIPENPASGQFRRAAFLTLAAFASPLAVYSQAVAPRPLEPKAAPAPASTAVAVASDEDITVLSPFEVTSTSDVGYLANNTLSGTRLRTELRDTPTAIQVVTAEFLKDTGATDNRSLLAFTTATEVSGPNGNFSDLGGGQTLSEERILRNPDQSTRVRGLTAADNTREFYQSAIPWDSYNVARVDLMRGANSILFGLGSPAGIINIDVNDAFFGKNTGSVEYRYGAYGSHRGTLDYNQVLLDKQLAVRVDALSKNDGFQQRPAYSRDNRLFGALRFDPSFLAKNGARTSIRGKFEKGESRSNLPRQLLPYDFITPFFDSRLNKIKIDARYVDERQTKTGIVNGVWGNGVTQKLYTDNSANPYYHPWVSSMGQVNGGIMYIYPEANSTSPSLVLKSTPNEVPGGRSPTGAIDGSITGIVGGRHRGVAGTAYASQNAVVPWDYAKLGQWKDVSLTDTSIFDYFNNLIDGPNKRVTSDFTASNLILEQTLFNGKVGFEFAYDRQQVNTEQLNFLNAYKVGVNIDINYILIDGTLNPNYGRPYLSDSAWSAGSNVGSTNDTSRRASGYWDFRLGDYFNKNSLLVKILGRHLFNAAYSDYRRETDLRRFQAYTTDAAWGSSINYPRSNDAPRQISTISYIGPSLAGRPNAVGANLSPLTAWQVPTSGTVRAFDSTWNAPSGVGFGDPWTTYFGSASTQSENPANYVGWSSRPLGVVNWSNPANRSVLYQSGQLGGLSVKSKVLVWQGYLMDGGLVATAGIREDIVKQFGYSAPQISADSTYDFSAYKLPSTAVYSVKGTPKTYGLVAHVNELVGWKDSPVKVSAFYTQSENFQPTSLRSDVYGRPLSPPTGETKDIGFLLSSRDDRYSLRMTWFKSNVLNATNDTLSGPMWVLGVAENWAYNNALIIRDNPAGKASWEFLTRLAGESDADYQTRRNNFADVYLKNLLPREFYDAWKIGDHTKNLAPFHARSETAKAPQGLTATSDIKSKGIELEFVANPTSNLRISANVAQVESVRDNVGGEIVDFVNSQIKRYDTITNGMRLGDFPFWSPTVNPASTGLTATFNNTFLGTYKLMLLQQGAAVPEIRKWRANVVATYSFNEGALKGAYVGGGYRWQSKATIGYAMKTVGTDATFDLDQQFRGPADDNLDFWVGYSRKLTAKIRWRIQLNVQNVLDGNGLIPINTQPDGTRAAYRIAPHRTWTIANTFSF